MQENTIIEKPKIGPVFWIILAAFLLLIIFFTFRQLFFLPVSANTLTDIVIEEGKQKTNSFKKYFPTPYSIKDLQREEIYDRH